jgi:hypothetical protein
MGNDVVRAVRYSEVRLCSFSSFQADDRPIEVSEIRISKQYGLASRSLAVIEQDQLIGEAPDDKH